MLAFPGISPQWHREPTFRNLRTSHSGGAAPESHRLPFDPPAFKLWTELVRTASRCQPGVLEKASERGTTCGDPDPGPDSSYDVTMTGHR